MSAILFLDCTDVAWEERLVPGEVRNGYDAWDGGEVSRMAVRGQGYDGS